MALKDKWIDKQDHVDYVKAEDINDIAHAVRKVTQWVY